jgi:hypothetical protein
MERITVLNPQISQPVAALPAACRPRALKDLMVGFVDNSKLNADRFIERLEPALREQYGIKTGANVRKFAPKDELGERELAELAKCAVVVQCYGD